MFESCLVILFGFYSVIMVLDWNFIFCVFCVMGKFFVWDLFIGCFKDEKIIYRMIEKMEVMKEEVEVCL